MEQRTKRNDFLGNVPPASEQLEKAVLGAIILENDTFHNASTVLAEDSFYFQPNREIWNAINFLDQNSSPIDAYSIYERLEVTKKLKDGLDLAYLTDIVDSVIGSAHLEDHIKIVEQKAMSRRLIQIKMQAIQELYSQEQNVMEILAKEDVACIGATGAIHSFKNTSPDYVGYKAEQQFELAMTSGGVTGVPSGIPSIDSILGGWRPGRIYLLAARTRMGKSAVAAAFAYNASAQGYPTLIFSMEMEDVELFNRLAAIRCREMGHKIQYSRIDKGKVTVEEAVIVREALAWCRKELHVYIDDTPNLNGLKMKSKLAKHIRDKDIKACFLDFVQIADLESDNQANGLSNFMTYLKNTSKELQVPILPLSQVSRLTEGNGGTGRGKLNELKGSGALEEKSDVVIMISRPEVLDEDPRDPITGMSEKGIMYMDILKNKMGETGLIKEPFDVATNWFAPLSEMIYDEEGNFKAAEPIEYSNSYSSPAAAQQAVIRSIKPNNPIDDDDPPF